MGSNESDPYKFDLLIEGSAMSTIFFSDLHIGDSRSKHHELLSYLKEHRKEFDKVVVLGDLFDFWVAPFEQVLSEATPMLEFLVKSYGSNFHYILGNHDNELLPLKQVFPSIHSSLKFPIGKKLAVALHGHVLDKNNYEQTSAAKMVAWIINKLNGATDTDIRKTLVSFSHFVGAHQYDDMLKAFDETLSSVFSGKYDYVITGHTHSPGIKRFGNLVSLNCGDSLQNSTVLIGNTDGFFLYDYLKKETLDICRI